MSQLKAQVNKLLSNVSNMLTFEDYVCEKVLPSKDSLQSTGILGAYGKGHLRIVNSLIGGRGEAREAKPIVRDVSNTYLIQSHGLIGYVTEDDYRNVEEPFDAEKDETMGVTTMLMNEKEKALADTLTDSAIVTQTVTLSGTAQWSDYNNSNPINNFKTAHLAVKAGCGRFPNAAIVPAAVARNLMWSPQILENLGYKQNRAGTLSFDEIAKAMGVTKLLVPDCMYNSAVEGQTDVLADIWGKHVVFYYAPETAGKYQISLGYYMKHPGMSKLVKKFSPEKSIGSTGIIVQDSYSFEIVDANCAYLLKSVIA